MSPYAAWPFAWECPYRDALTRPLGTCFHGVTHCRECDPCTCGKCFDGVINTRAVSNTTGTLRIDRVSKP